MSDCNIELVIARLKDIYLEHFLWNYPLIMSQYLADDKSTRIMAWCHQATSDYLSQCWSSLILPYCHKNNTVRLRLFIHQAQECPQTISGQQYMCLNHWHLNQIGNILQTTFSGAFLKWLSLYSDLNVTEESNQWPVRLFMPWFSRFIYIYFSH